MKIIIENESSRLLPPCPICKKSGQKVNIKTVRSLIKSDLKDTILEKQYYLCMSPDCPVAYYAEVGNHFDKDDLLVPIWFKEQSPVPICYCKNVTDADIQEHITDRRCCTNLEDIQKHTGANTGKECLTKNPTGK